MKLSRITLFYLFNFFRNGTFIGAILVPFFTDWGNITLFQAQILQSWFAFWIFILEVPTGAVADFFGRKYSLILGALVNIAAVLLYGSFPHFYNFLLSEFLFAAGAALMSGADEAWVYDTLKEEGRTEQAVHIFGRAKTFSLTGILFGSILGSFIASKYGLNYPMLLSAIPLFVAAIIASMLKEPIKSSTTTTESTRYRDLLVSGITSLKKNKQLRILLLNSLGVSTAAYFVIWFYQPLLKSVHIPVFYYGFFHAGLVLVEILIASQFKRLIRIFGSIGRLLLLSAIVTSLSIMLVALYPHIATIITLLIFAGGFGLTRLDLISPLTHACIKSGDRASVSSSLSMVRRLAQAVFNPLIGAIADKNLLGAVFVTGLLPIISIVYHPQTKAISEEQ